MNRTRLLAALLTTPFAHAEMTALDNEQLSDVQGAGIGFVLDSAMVDGNKATIVTNDMTNTATGQDMPIAARESCVTATGNNRGSTLAPVTLNRLSFLPKLNPAKSSALTTQLDDGRVVNTLPGTTDVIELALPSLVSGADDQPYIAGYAGTGGNCLSRASEKVDASIRFNLGIISTRTDVLGLDFPELTIDDPYLHFWGANVRSQLVGEIRLDLHARISEIMSCGTGSPSCAGAAERAVHTVYLTNTYTNVALGYGKSQPLLFSATTDGNFTFEPPKLALANAVGFYVSAPRTGLVIENFDIGGIRPGYRQILTDDYDMGHNKIFGLSFDYLKVMSHSL